MYVVFSPDGGTTWTGNQSTPLLGGGKPFKVNLDTGTHFFPAVAVGKPGQVVVAYLKTEALIPVEVTGKTHPGGVPSATWTVVAAQTDNLNAANPGDVRWARTQVTPTPMHMGDICNLGIFCVPTVSNRNLLDFIQVTLDTAGCAHIAFTNDFRVALIQAANQKAGCFTPTSQAVTPVTPAPSGTPTTTPALAPLPNTGTAGRGGSGAVLALLAAIAGVLLLLAARARGSASRET